MSGSVWRLSVAVPKPVSAAVGDALVAAGATSLSEVPAGARVLLHCFAQRKSDALSLQRAAQAVLDARGLTSVTAKLERLTRDQWLAPWRRSLVPEPVCEGFVIQPAWDRTRAPAGTRRLWIEPELVFGVGGHPSTRLAASAVRGWCRSHPGRGVLDVGTGTGVLALIAVLSGASAALGLDRERRAVASARRHARVNEVPNARFSTRPLHTIPRRYPLVVANIEAHILTELATDLVRVTGHTLILAGLLLEQEDELVRRFAELGLTRRSGDGTWACVELERTVTRR